MSKIFYQRFGSATSLALFYSTDPSLLEKEKEGEAQSAIKNQQSTIIDYVQQLF